MTGAGIWKECPGFFLHFKNRMNLHSIFHAEMIWKNGSKPCLQTVEFSQFLEIEIWPSRPFAFYLCFCIKRSRLYRALYLMDSLSYLATRRMSAVAISASTITT